MVTGEELSLKLLSSVGGSHVIPTGFAPPRPRARRPYSRQRHFQRSWHPVATPLHSSPDLGEYLHNLPPFLPVEQVRSAFGTAAVTAVMLSLARMAVRRRIASSQSDTQKDKKRTDRRSLQAMYLVANTGLTTWGIATLIPMLRSGVWQTSTLARAEGHVALGAFGSAQAGYSIWSIVTDQRNAYFRGNKLDEGTVMLLHHCIIVLVGMILATCNLGFRVYAPFFCGVAELSSVPLVIMKGLAKGRRKGYHASRVVFAATFLSVRIVAWLVFVRLYLIDLMNVISLSGKKMGIAVLVPWGATIPVLILTLLQLYWGLVIVKDVVKMVHRLNSTTTRSSS